MSPCLPCCFLGDNLRAQGCIDITLFLSMFLKWFVWFFTLFGLHCACLKSDYLIPFGCWGIAPFPDLKACLEEERVYGGCFWLFCGLRQNQYPWNVFKSVFSEPFLLIMAQLLVSVFFELPASVPSCFVWMMLQVVWEERCDFNTPAALFGGLLF